jgi:hypothetical protein
VRNLKTLYKKFTNVFTATKNKFKKTSTKNRLTELEKQYIMILMDKVPKENRTYH